MKKNKEIERESRYPYTNTCYVAWLGVGTMQTTLDIYGPSDHRNINFTDIYTGNITDNLTTLKNHGPSGKPAKSWIF